MNVIDNGDYSNIIMKAVIVNNDTGTDPEGKSRVQVYIPQIHYEYASIYQAYMNAGDKTSTGHFDKFPWAVSVVEGLEIGNEVYICNVNNKGDEYIVLGVEANETSNYNWGVSTAGRSGINIYTTEVGSVTDFAMPIIIHNEVGIDVNAWPNGIADSYYSKITPYDNGGWSIGLIQWHEARAYDVLNYICTQDSDWQARFTDKGTDLFNDLASNSQTARLKYQADYHPTPGSALYNSIQSLLSGSDIAKWAQRNYASQDTATNIAICQKAGVSNVAILVFMADLMNQYGPNLPSTIQTAASISNNFSAGTEGQFNSFVQACKNNPSLHYERYATRRGNTVAYIQNLFNQGLINNQAGANSIALDVTSTGLVQPGNEQIYLNGEVIGGSTTSVDSGYIFPIEGRTKSSVTIGGSYASHSGVDFTKIPRSTKIVAVADGTVVDSFYASGSYGEHVKIKHKDGNVTVYAHMVSGSRQVSAGQSIAQGTVLGLLDNTGNSHGDHLHFEVREGGAFKRTGFDLNFHTKWLP